jgi:transcriptional repressor NrdR
MACAQLNRMVYSKPLWPPDVGVFWTLTPISGLSCLPGGALEFGMNCPYCDGRKTRVIDTSRDTRGVRRRRECLTCGQRFNTVERAILTTPLVVKGDGRREEFDRDKVLTGIRVACAKRPVAAEAIEGLVDRVEAKLRSVGKAEVNAKTIGDIVIEELKELDRVAYIRFAIVYLGLDDLEAVRSEIDRLMS